MKDLWHFIWKTDGWADEHMFAVANMILVIGGAAILLTIALLVGIFELIGFAAFYGMVIALALYFGPIRLFRDYKKSKHE